MLPSSILLLIAAVGGLAALVPSLVRRYDRKLRADFELRTSMMRVLRRRRRRTTVPGQVPVAPPSAVLEEPADEPVTQALPDLSGYVPGASGRAVVSGALVPGSVEDDAAVYEALKDADESFRQTGPIDLRPDTISLPAAAWLHLRRALIWLVSLQKEQVTRVGAAQKPAARTTGRAASGPEPSHWWRRRRRRVVTVLALLVAGQVAGLLAVGPGFLVGLSVSAILLIAYLSHLRNRAVAERRRTLALLRRRRRARDFAAVVMTVAGAAELIGSDAERSLVAWVATPASARRRPPDDSTIALLARGGYQVVQTTDGRMGLRRAPAPPEPPRRAPARTDKPAATTPPFEERKVANL
ncbi:hypothetical protein GCM10009765_74970 [Fodinicola feengrottensis]|uniref:DUF2207 domain-containing protein n=2 Tax=Fodinicola feengrottensis TaxID=435914 RepID=A0ABN2IZU4_9ACTN